MVHLDNRTFLHRFRYFARLLRLTPSVASPPPLVTHWAAPIALHWVSERAFEDHLQHAPRVGY